MNPTDEPSQLPELSASVDQVHAAWLEAGSRDDVATLQRLKTRFPLWLDLQRETLPTADAAPRPRFCSWRGFHLRTLGASTMHTAAWDGKLNTVRFLLEAGQSPDTKDDNAMTPAMIAIMRLNLVTMRCVIVNGAAVRRNLVVNCRDDEDQQRENVIDLLRLLLRFGADVDKKSQDGKTALHCATGDDAFEVARFLVDAGAKIDVQDETGKTPLHYCVQERGLLVTNLLLSRGANIDIEDDRGLTPLTRLVSAANVSVLQIFLNHHHLVATPQRLDFAAALLFLAVDSHVEAVVHFLLESEYTSITVTNAEGETPLHRSIVTCDAAMMELLADLDGAGDNLTAATVHGETPAHYAARYGAPEVLEAYLQCVTSVFGELEGHGAANPLNAVNQTGETALYITGTHYSSLRSSHRASSENEVDAGDLVVRDEKARLLLQHGAWLFAPGFLARELEHNTVLSRENAPCSLCFSLPVQVQRCLRSWLVEDDSDRSEPEIEDGPVENAASHQLQALTELAMEWLAVGCCRGSSMALLSIVVCSGYCHELVPMLVELPLRRRYFVSWLRCLEKFARRRSDHALLIQLQRELRAASQELTTTS